MSEIIKKWYEVNFALLAEVLQTTVEHNQFSILHIASFTLPEKLYNHSQVKLLIKLGGLENYDNPQAFSFYTIKGLKRADGQAMKHYLEETGYNDLSKYGWARISYHLKSFQPNIASPRDGDLLIDVLEGLYFFFAQKTGV